MNMKAQRSAQLPRTLLAIGVGATLTHVRQRRSSGARKV
jgi:hypothetical protein